MRTLIVALLLVLCSLPMLAARQMTVAELRQKIEQQIAAHKKDDSIASQLEDVELEERLLQPQAEEWARSLKAGPKTSQMLMILASYSSFQSLPASQIPTQPLPSRDELKQMWARLIAYDAGMLKGLPNFLAMRETRFANNLPRGFQAGFHLHMDQTRRYEITYRNGVEVSTPFSINTSAKKLKTEPFTGLGSSGEFGSMLYLVLTDLEHGRVQWSRWEPSAKGDLAVLQFQVSKAASHFHVRVECCVTGAAFESRLERKLYNDSPAYHGTMSIDPLTGALVRFVIEPEFDPHDFINTAAIAIDYGPVMIGDKQFQCPVHSVALLTVGLRKMLPSDAGPLALRNLSQALAFDAERENAVMRWVNETEFKDYHRFASSVRMLLEDGQPMESVPEAQQK